MSKWTDEEMTAFLRAVSDAGVDPALALEVYNFESGLNPHALNPRSGAQGLAQMMPQFLPGWGFTGDPSQFHQLGVMEQCPFIRTLLRGQLAALGRPPLTAAKLFHLNLYPATAKTDVVFDGRKASQAQAYAANKILDVGGKGFVDEDDLARRLEAAKGPAFVAALDQLNRLAFTAQTPVMGEETEDETEDQG